MAGRVGFWKLWSRASVNEALFCFGVVGEGALLVTVPYLVNDVEASVEFNTKQLEFELEQQFGPAMAIVRKDDSTLWSAGPQSLAAKPVPDGSRPAPGGWNRMVLTVEDLPSLVARLASAGTRFRNEILKDRAARRFVARIRQATPSELFQP